MLSVHDNQLTGSDFLLTCFEEGVEVNLVGIEFNHGSRSFGSDVCEDFLSITIDSDDDIIRVRRFHGFDVMNHSACLVEETERNFLTERSNQNLVRTEETFNEYIARLRRCVIVDVGVGEENRVGTFLTILCDTSDNRQ